MTISRIFYMSGAIGLIFGVAIMMVANGLSGYITITEALVTFYIILVGGIGLLIPLIQKLLPVWKLLIVTWLPDNGIETVKTPE